METIRVNMTPCEDVQTIHASQNDNEAREWGFELHNNGEKIDSSSISDQLVFKAYEGGTEQILPENGSTPTTSPFKGDIKYPQGLLSDQEFLYRESPTEEDGLAWIKNIKGNTLVWNQLVQQNGATETMNGVSFTNNNDGSWTVNGTATNGNPIKVVSRSFSLINGHKYLVAGGVDGGGNTTYRLDIRQISVGAVIKEFYNEKEIWTSNVTGNDYQFAIRVQNGTTVNNFKYRPQIFDLTQMGLDISSPSEFTSLFPLPYYAYNQGTLLSFMGNGIKTVGKNLVSNSMWEQGAFDGATGQPVSAGARIRTNQFIRVIANVQYTFSMESTRQIYIYRYSMDGTYIGYYPNAWVSTLSYTPTQNELIKIALRKSDNTTINTSFINDAQFQMEIGTETSYVPYTESTLSLPISTYFPNGMNGVNDVYDELTPIKAISRLGIVDLGSLDWVYSGSEGHQRMLANLPLAKIGVPNVKSNILCPVYTTDTNFHVYEHTSDKIIALNDATPTQVAIYDSAYTDATAFKTAMNGVYLYYELATSTETSFTTASLVTENAEIPLSNDDGVLIGKCTEELSAEPGFHDAKIKLADEDGECYSNKIQLHIERSPQ